MNNTIENNILIMKRQEIQHSDEMLEQAQAIVSAGTIPNDRTLFILTLGQSEESKDVRFVLYRLLLKCESPHVNPFKFEAILADDLIVAAKKAKSYCGNNPIEIDFGRQNKIAAWGKYTPDVVRFGKNYGNKLSECDEKFVVWVAKGCPLYSEEYQSWVNHHFGGEPFMQIARKVASELGYGLTVEISPNNFQFFGNEQYAKYLEKKAMMESLIHDHHDTQGQRVTKRLTIVKVAGYESDFGYVEIITFRDEENRVYTYKGTSYPTKAIVGRTRNIMGTIKHGQYREQKQTFLQRIKILPCTFEEYKELRAEYVGDNIELDRESRLLVYNALVSEIGNEQLEKFESMIVNK